MGNPTCSFEKWETMSLMAFLGFSNKKTSSEAKDVKVKDRKIWFDLRPKSLPAKKPIIDSLTRKVTASIVWAIEEANRINHFVNGPQCTCRCGGATTPHRYFVLSNGEWIKPYAIHVIAYHRHELTDDDLRFAESLMDGENDPSEAGMEPPWKIECFTCRHYKDSGYIKNDSLPTGVETCEHVCFHPDNTAKVSNWSYTFEVGNANWLPQDRNKNNDCQDFYARRQFWGD